jgi:ABC-type branched-subunit amino acid transport system ATPase component
MTKALLEIKELSAGYGDIKILDGVNIHVPQGAIVTIVGPNGAGKSTILKAIYGIARIMSGEVVVNSVENKVYDIGRMKPHTLTTAGISYVPQIDNVFATLTVDENLDVGYWSRAGITLEERKSEIYRQYPDLLTKKKNRAGSLSGGQRQMLALARALMSAPEILLLDEPSAGLAPALVDQLFDELVRINRSGGTILMVEQNARRALEISDFGYVLDMGKNRHEGSGKDLAVDPEIVGIYFGKR